MQYSAKNTSDIFVPLILALAVGAGVIFPVVSEMAAPFVFPALFLLLTFSLSLATDRPLSVLAKPDPAVWGIMLWQMAFIPLLVILAGWALNMAPDLHLMLLATAISSTVFAAPTIAHLLKLKSPLPVNGMILSTFLMPVAFITFGKLLEGDGMELSLEQYIYRVALFLLLPLSISVWMNSLIRHMSSTLAAKTFSVLRFGSVAALLAFGVGIMDGVGEQIATNHERVLIFLAISVGFSLATVFGTIALFWSMGRDLTIAATILSVHRNLGLTYALIGSAAGSDFAVFVAVSQIPMFLSPLLIHLIRGAATKVEGKPASQPELA